MMKVIIQYNFKDVISLDSSNVFMKGTFNQAFPASSINEPSKEGTIKTINKSLLNSIFRVDLSNPVTYAQAQFPASYLHENTYTNENSDSENVYSEKSDNDKPVVYFQNYDGTEVVVQPEDDDDLGELRSGGVYLLEENNVVDSVDNNTNIDLSNINKPKSIKFEKGKPQILIYHTHGTESYYPATEGNYHTLKTEYTVILIAEIMTRELEKRGFEVIHNQKLHDYPSYGGSYGRSLATARDVLNNNKSVKVVLDIHRDGFDNVESSPNRERLMKNNTVNINGELATRFQFIIGPDSQNRPAVESFAKYVKEVSDKKYPGFSKPILVKNIGKYNQFLSDYYGLLEVGSNVNTIEQAERSAVYLADVLATSLEAIKE